MDTKTNEPTEKEMRDISNQEWNEAVAHLHRCTSPNPSFLDELGQSATRRE